METVADRVLVSVAGIVEGCGRCYQGLRGLSRGLFGLRGVRRRWLVAGEGLVKLQVRMSDVASVEGGRSADIEGCRSVDARIWQVSRAVVSRIRDRIRQVSRAVGSQIVGYL